jgi:two-component system NarL family sensor kinase
MALFRSLFRPNYAQKLSLLATIPLVVAVAAIAALVAYQARDLANQEIEALETQLLKAKKEELRNYVTQARNGFYFIYGSAQPDDQVAKDQVAQIPAAKGFSLSMITMAPIWSARAKPT